MRFLLPALLLPALFAQTTTERAHGYLSEGLDPIGKDSLGSERSERSERTA